MPTKGVVEFSKYLKKEFKDKEFRKYYEEEGIYADVAVKIALLRQKKGYSQKEVAKLLGTTQQTVSRIENTENTSLSVNTLLKLAQVFHKNLRIQFI